MAERMAAQIWIGGRLSANQAEELCGAINTEWVSLEWGDGRFCPDNPQDLLRAIVEYNDGLTLRLCNDQASWGEFADLESFLQDQEIPYTRQGEAGGGYNGEIVEYRPGTDPVTIPVDANENPTVDVDAMRRVAKTLDAALEQLSAGNLHKAASQLKRAQQAMRKHLPPDIPPLPSFEIEGHQPTEENHG